MTYARTGFGLAASLVAIGFVACGGTKGAAGSGAHGASSSTGGGATSTGSSSLGGAIGATSSSSTGGASASSSASASGGGTSTASASSSSGAACPVTLGTQSPRGGDTPSFVNASNYDYSPSVMLDGVYRMWWCCGGNPPGDHICYAEASSLDGPWHGHGSTAPNSFDDVFQGTQNGSDFDGVDTCDPSVIRVDGTYYMFYGGIPDYKNPSVPTQIGVATGPDGRTWTRLNGGKPIISYARDPNALNLPNKYGAGQPSVTFVDGKFYVVFTDTTGVASNPQNGAGQYVMRSADPTFQTGVEELTANGFVPYGQAPHTGYSVLETYGSDMQYVDAVDMFVLANSGTYSDGVALHFYDKTTWKETVSPALKIPGHWTEEPALASRPDKHAQPWGGDCGTVAFDVMRSVGGSTPGSWDLAHAGIDVTTGLDCACAPLGRMLEGTLLAVPNLPLTLVRGGTRLQFALGPPALRLAKTQVNPGAAVFNAIPYGASVFAGNEAIQAPGQPGAYLLDDQKLWPVSCAGELTDDMTMLTMVDAATYGSYPIAFPLYCVQ